MIEATAVRNISHSSGHAPVPGCSSPPASAESAAPPPIMIAPERPEAVPARCGRTDSAPAVALGMVMPLPRPTKVMKPKNVHSDWKPAAKTSSAVPRPAVLKMQPQKIILLIPTRAESLPDSPLPAK